jgi:hypothetical protein
VIIDRSTTVPDGLFCRTSVVWDAIKVKIDDLPQLANRFVRETVSQLGLELPS